MCIRDRAQSVIDELQTLADSSSNEKRAKGRRGLKLLKELRELYGRRLVINPTKYEGNGVDEKLLRITCCKSTTCSNIVDSISKGSIFCKPFSSHS